MVVFGLSFMVPIAPFGVFGSVFAASRGQVVGAYLVGAGVMGLTACSFVVMAREYVGVGSVHTFVSRAVGPVAGFLAGWMLLLDYLLVPALIALVTANGLHAAVPTVPAAAWIIGLVVVAMALNIVGIARVVSVGATLLIVQLAVLAVFVAAAVAALAARPVPVLEPLVGPGGGSPLLAGAAVAVLSYLGFESIATLGEENRERRAAVGRAIVVALAVCAALFVVQCWCAALLVPDPAGLVARGDPDGAAFYAAADVAGGPWLVAAAGFCAAGAGVANALVAQAATARLLLGFARAGQAPAALARVGARRGVPTAAALVVAVLAAVVAWCGRGGRPGDARDTGQRRRAHRVRRPARGGGAPVRGRGGSRRPVHLLVPVLGLATIVAVVVSSADVARSLGAAWLALGAVLAVRWRRRSPQAGEDAPQVVDGGGADDVVSVSSTGRALGIGTASIRPPDQRAHSSTRSTAWVTTHPAAATATICSSCSSGRSKRARRGCSPRSGTRFQSPSQCRGSSGWRGPKQASSRSSVPSSCASANSLRRGTSAERGYHARWSTATSASASSLPSVSTASTCPASRGATNSSTESERTTTSGRSGNAER